MLDRPFFDTNIIVYAFQYTDDRWKVAESLLRGGGRASVQLLNEYVNVSRRRYLRPWDGVSAELQIIEALLQFEPITMETHRAGVRIARACGFSIYDSLMIAAAGLAGCTRLYSQDLQHGQVVEGVRIVDPFRVASP